MTDNTFLTAPSERLLMHTIRRLADGCHDACDLIRSIDAGLVAHVYKLMRCIDDGARRRMRLHPPGCTMTTADENSLLHLLAAAQRKDAREVEARLCWLVKHRGRKETRRAVLDCAEAATRCGLDLPHQQIEAPCSGLPALVRVA